MKNLRKTLIASILVISSAAPLAAIAEEINTESVTSHAAESLNSLDSKIVGTLYKDLDQDGIQDKLDHCPNTLLGVAVDKLGCEIDTDQDGVFNRLDQCQDSPTGAKVNVFGCESDADGDGVTDSKDLCPNTPEGVKVNEQGCVPMEVVTSNIIFDTNEHAIRPDQAITLHKDAATLNDLKPGEVILITGHTDSTGQASTNERLSWLRANSTKEFIVTKLGLDSNRVYVSGKGAMEPIAENTTISGRQINRRIQLDVISQEKLPESASLTLPKEAEKK